jgi:hypothetical protein
MDERTRTKDLMDRIQAGDLKSYLALQTPAEFPDVHLIPRTDEAELQQLKDLGAGQGLGYDLNDDAEFGDSLGEFGIESGQWLARNEP